MLLKFWNFRIATQKKIIGARFYRKIYNIFNIYFCVNKKYINGLLFQLPLYVFLFHLVSVLNGDRVFAVVCKFEEILLDLIDGVLRRVGRWWSRELWESTPIKQGLLISPEKTKVT